MAIKKKSPTAKSVGAPQSVLHDGALARPHAATNPRSESEAQLQAFTRAMLLFRTQQFEEAKAAFEHALAGPQKEITHNAKLHMMMCDRRIEQPVMELDSLDDHYNYAIERMNARDLVKARKHLDCAMQLVHKDGNTAPDHLYYALALCASISGDADTAFVNLKQAIELNPRNRTAARQDSDLASVAQQPQIKQLLYPEKQAGPF